MNTWLKRAAWGAIALVVAAAAGRAYVARQSKAQEAQTAAAQTKAPVVFELAAQDTVRAQQGNLVQSVVVSGSVKAVQTATVKARVAGELRGLGVREGDSVKAGQVLAQVDTTEYAARVQQARQQAQAAASQVDIARRSLDNNQALVTQGFISKTALDTSLANLDGAQANHRAALAAQDIAQKALADTHLRSPITGQVAARWVQNGERVGVDARVLDLVDLSALEVEAALPPGEAARLAVGQTATLQVEGLVNPVAARVVRMSPTAQAASRSVLVYLKLEATPGLRHGLFAEGRVIVGQRPGVLVPANSVRNDKPQTYVQQIVAGDGGTRVAHTAVQVVAQGQAEGAENTPLSLVTGIASNSILVSGRAGFIQENTAISLSGPVAPSATINKP
jgi:membrane fusion protein, multidrug efflux system